MGLLQPLLGTADLGAPEISLSAGYASGRTVVAGESSIHLRQRSAITGLRLFQGSAVVPIFQIGEHGAGLNRVAFMHVDFLDHAFDLRLNLRAA